MLHPAPRERTTRPTRISICSPGQSCGRFVPGLERIYRSELLGQTAEPGAPSSGSWKSLARTSASQKDSQSGHSSSALVSLFSDSAQKSKTAHAVAYSAPPEIWSRLLTPTAVLCETHRQARKEDCEGDSAKGEVHRVCRGCSSPCLGRASDGGTQRHPRSSEKVGTRFTFGAHESKKHGAR